MRGEQCTYVGATQWYPSTVSPGKCAAGGFSATPFLVFPAGRDDPSFTALTDRNTVLIGYVAMGEDLRLVLRQQGVTNDQALVSGP
jgi:hypothetical protein